MNGYQHEPKDIIPYTPKIPPCPKCGSKNTKRRYRKGGGDYGNPYYWNFDKIEFLEVICKDCGYSFPQKIKER